ncbi:MAG: hypothetical protein SFU83_05060 [Meiothermus sp.]|nr:hypothetical protein [Meiothermus sp.]
MAAGFGVTPEDFRMHRSNKPDELVEGRHYINVKVDVGGKPHSYWTKAGIIRLGFFIKSERSKKFRDFAEELVLDALEAPAAPAPAPALPANPLTLALLEGCCGSLGVALRWIWYRRK